jgi:hypothetical protein
MILHDLGFVEALSIYSSASVFDSVVKLIAPEMELAMGLVSRNQSIAT